MENNERLINVINILSEENINLKLKIKCFQMELNTLRITLSDEKNLSVLEKDVKEDE